MRVPASSSRIGNLYRGVFAVLGRVPIVLLMVGVVGCGSPDPSDGPTRSLGPGEQWLPVADLGPNGLCAGGGFIGEFRLHGSPDDVRIAWMTFPDGSRRELGWPAGTRARFTPNLEVVGPAGQVIAREGSMVKGGCPTFDRGILLGEFDSPAP